MPKKTTKPLKNKGEALGKSSPAPTCSSLAAIAPNITETSKQSRKQQIRGISANKPEIEGSNPGESAKSPEFKAEFPGETSEALDSSVSQPKALKIQAFTKKPQISSVPGISPRERHRYRVTLGSEVLGERLILDQALELAKGVRADG